MKGRQFKKNLKKLIMIMGSDEMPEQFKSLAFGFASMAKELKGFLSVHKKEWIDSQSYDCYGGSKQESGGGRNES